MASGSAAKPRTGLAERAMSGLAWTAGGKGVHAALQLLVLGILARLLTPADFGVVSAALFVIGLSALFSQLGFGPAVVQRPVLEPRHLRTALTASALFGVALGGGLWLGAPLAAAFFREPAVQPVLRALALVFPLRGLTVVAESLLQRALRFRAIAAAEVTAYALGYGGVGIVLAFRGAGVWALVGAQIAQAVLLTAILFVLQPPPRPGLERRAFTELLYFGGGFTLARIGNYLALQGDALVVARWLGPAALGVYGRAHQLVTMPASLLGEVVDKVLFPTMAAVQQDAPRLAAAYRRALALVALAVLPTSAVLFVLAPEVIRVALGAGWAGVELPFRVFCAGMIFRTSYKLGDSLARATGAVYRRAWRQGVYATLVVGGALVGQRWGVSGVALAVLGAVVANYALMTQLSVALVPLRWLEIWRAQRPGVALSLVAGSAAWLVATPLRHGAARAPVVLLLAAAASVVIALAAMRWGPAALRGPDAPWMLRLLRGAAPAPLGRFLPT